MKFFTLTLRISLVLLVLFIIALALLNPSKQAFIDYAEKQMMEQVETNSEDATAWTEEAKELARSMADRMIDRKNYFIGSVFVVNLGNKQYHYLGLASFFIPLQDESPSIGM